MSHPIGIWPALAWALAIVLLAGTAVAEDPGREVRFGPGPLASMPSDPGPHMEKIAALGDNAWLSLGEPKPDPKWGKARGRTWSSNQPMVSELGGMLVFGEGVHAFVKPDGHYMNDLWFYDINAHGWVCLDTGIDTKTIAQRIRDRKLIIDRDGALIDADTRQPVPPLLIHAYGCLGYDPEYKQFVVMADQFQNYFATGERGVLREAYTLYLEQLGEKEPSLGLFGYQVGTGTWGVSAVIRKPPDPRFGANTLVYVDRKAEFFYGGTDGVWFFGPGGNRFVDAKPQGQPPVGIDHTSVYDPKRNLIYYFQRDGDGAAENFLIYDVSENAWRRAESTGSAPHSATSRDSIVQFDPVNDRLIIIRHARPEQSPLAVYAYDPEANTWEEPRPLPEDVKQAIRNGTHGSFDPKTNAFYCHFASDSRDDGTMWVYRYKKAD